MSITRVAQSPRALTAALNTIFQHLGQTSEAVLNPVTSLVLRVEIIRLCPAIAFTFASGETNLGATGAFGVANGGVAAVAGNTFVLSAVSDSSDRILASAKGSAPVRGDMFVVTGTGTTVAYVGASA